MVVPDFPPLTRNSPIRCHPYHVTSEKSNPLVFSVGILFIFLWASGFVAANMAYPTQALYAYGSTLCRSGGDFSAGLLFA